MSSGKSIQMSVLIEEFKIIYSTQKSELDISLEPLPVGSMLTESEQHQLLVEWNDTATEYPSDKCIHQLFAEQVSRTPDAVAVVFSDEQLTYQELNSRANQLAHYLQSVFVSCDRQSLNILSAVKG